MSTARIGAAGDDAKIAARGREQLVIDVGLGGGRFDARSTAVAVFAVARDVRRERRAAVSGA
jgi:hypothetical protein